jgi:hypothetical protein
MLDVVYSKSAFETLDIILYKLKNNTDVDNKKLKK